MKVVNVFAHVFSILAFLTLGSLLLIVAFHILPLEDALMNIREIYSNPWHSFQTALTGLLFISVGLFFSRLLLKKGRGADALLYQTDSGPILISISAIEDLCKKALKKFHLVKDSKIKSIIHGKNIEIRARLVLWSNGQVQQLLLEVQDEIRSRVQKLVGQEIKLEVICDVIRMDDHENHFSEAEPQQTAV